MSTCQKKARGRRRVVEAAVESPSRSGVKDSGKGDKRRSERRRRNWRVNVKRGNLLQINEENVVNASHEYAVRLIKKSGAAVTLKVLRIMAFGVINAATLQKPPNTGE